MKNFKDFNIQTSTHNLVGDKIKIDRVLNKEISVYDFRLEDSKYGDGNSKCLYLQIKVNDEMRLIFTSSKPLIDAVQQVPKTDFPFTTTIIKENERYIFT